MKPIQEWPMKTWLRMLPIVPLTLALAFPSDTLASVADTAAFTPILSDRPQISALSVTTSSPFTLLTITGKGFDLPAELSVRFSDSYGFAVEVPLVGATPTTLTVAVPPYFDQHTGAVSSGNVSLQVIRTARPADLPAATFGVRLIRRSSAWRGTFYIQSLPMPAARPGVLTLSMLKASVSSAHSLQAGIKGTSLDTPALNAAIANEITSLNSFMVNVNAVVQNPTLNVSIGSVNGKEVTINAANLHIADQMLLGMAFALTNAGAGQLLDEGSRSVPLDAGLLAASSCMGAEAAALVEGQSLGDARIDQYTQNLVYAPRQSAACNSAESFNLGYKVVAGAAAVGIGLAALAVTALAGPEIALAAVALSSAVILAATIEGAGGMIAVGGALGQSSPGAVKLVQGGVDKIRELSLGTFKILLPQTVGASILTGLGVGSLFDAFTSAPPYNSGVGGTAGPFDGVYSGTVAGTTNIGGNKAVADSLGFAIAGGQITVTYWSSGSGIVSTSGSASFSIKYGSLNCPHTGTFVTISPSGVTANGIWACDVGPEYFMSGTWKAERQ